MDPILTHISNVFLMFYANVVRRRVGEVTKNATDLSQHETLNGAYGHEMTLCVMFFAPNFLTHFRFCIRCSKYTVIHMVWGTCVPQTILCVTFGARPRSIPFSLLDALFGNLARQGRPRPPGDSGMVPPSDHLGCQRCPGMPSRPYFDMPAATSKPPVGYLS